MRSDDAALARRLRLVVGRLGRQLRYQQIGELTSSQLSALYTVEIHGPTRLSELASREQVSAATLSRCIATLESDELLERRVDPSDHRASLLALAPGGSQLLDDLRPEHTTRLAHRIGGLTSAQQRILAAALPVLETLVSNQTRPDM